MKKDRFVVVERDWEAVLCRVDSETGNEIDCTIDCTVEMEWDDLRQQVIDLYNRYAETHPGTNPDFFVERFSELNYSDPIPAWIGSKSPLVYHVLGRPGMVTIGCASLAFGRAMNHGWAILATPGAESAWPDGWTRDDAADAEAKVKSLETAGAALDEILRLDQVWRDLFDNETACRGRWYAASNGLSYESVSRYAFYAIGCGRCFARLTVRTSQFGDIYINLKDGEVSLELDTGYQEFHEAYRETWVPDQICRYVQELGRMGAYILPSAGMFLEAMEFVEDNL